jgi:hypothetical protein
MVCWCWCTIGQLIVQHFGGFAEADNDACPPHREQDWTKSAVLWIHIQINKGLTAVLMTENHPVHHKAMEYMGEL